MSNSKVDNMRVLRNFLSTLNSTIYSSLIPHKQNKKREEKNRNICEIILNALSQSFYSLLECHES